MYIPLQHLRRPKSELYDLVPSRTRVDDSYTEIKIKEAAVIQMDVSLSLIHGRIPSVHELCHTSLNELKGRIPSVRETC
jgi:hypothetical protein